MKRARRGYIRIYMNLYQNRRCLPVKIRMTAEQSNKDNFLIKVIDKYHFEQKDKPLIEEVYEELLRTATPFAIYKINQWLTGLKYIDDGQVALVAMTLGKGPDILEETYTEAGKLTEAYMVECLSNEILLGMYSEFNQLYARFHRRYVTRYVFIGDDIPVSQMKDILDKLQQCGENSTAEIVANEYGVLTPSKSVVFYAMLSDDPYVRCEGVCVGCHNTNCDNRISKSDSSEASASDKRNFHLNSGLNYGYRRIFGEGTQKGGKKEHVEG